MQDQAMDHVKRGIQEHYNTIKGKKRLTMDTLAQFRKPDADQQDIQTIDQDGFLLCPFRGAYGKDGSEFRNQFGRKWVQSNDGKMPSIN